MSNTLQSGDGAITRAEGMLGVEFFDYQLHAFRSFPVAPGNLFPRFCLYYKTGAGKSITALTCLWLDAWDSALVIAPPSTHPAWMETAAKLGMDITCISHAKFRQKNFKLKRDQAVIADEFHLFGGHTGQGWKKLDRLARGLKAPLILASATPNYNDAERCYCIQHILDPVGTAGGYVEWLYKNCETKHNPFSMTPDVVKFRLFPEAKDFLAAMTGVVYLPDDLVYSIEPIMVNAAPAPDLDTYGFDQHNHKMIASSIEEKHTRDWRNAVVPRTKTLRNNVWQNILSVIRGATGPVLVFCAHSSIAEVVANKMADEEWRVGLVTGKTTAKKKDEMIARFNRRDLTALVGTASLATGTDGMDKVCDRLIIVDDTDDDALRRQLIGRIMPRGASSGKPHTKRVFKLEYY